MKVPALNEGSIAKGERRTFAFPCAGLDVGMFDAFLDSLWPPRPTADLPPSTSAERRPRPHMAAALVQAASEQGVELSRDAGPTSYIDTQNIQRRGNLATAWPLLTFSCSSLDGSSSNGGS